MRQRLLAVSFTFLFVAYASPSYAAAITFFGEDIGLGEGIRLSSHPNADAARASFFANLTGVGTETFESFATGTTGPLAISFGSAGTATLTGGAVRTQVSGTNGFGRYPISGNNYWESGTAMALTFSNPIAAFGFYGVDIGDFNGQVTLTTVSGSPLVLNIGNSTNVPGGGVLYFGFYVDDPNQAFTGITFGNTRAGTDFFAFDDFSIGTLEQVTPGAPVPEPGSMMLLGSGLFALSGAVRRRLRKQ